MSTMRQSVNLHFDRSEKVCRVDLGWMSGALQNCSNHSPSPARKGREKYNEGSWVKIRTGKDHSPINSMGKTNSAWRKENEIDYRFKSE